jgi:hypothetical protein
MLFLENDDSMRRNMNLKADPATNTTDVPVAVKFPAMRLERRELQTTAPAQPDKRWGIVLNAAAQPNGDPPAPMLWGE